LANHSIRKSPWQDLVVVAKSQLLSEEEVLGNQRRSRRNAHRKNLTASAVKPPRTAKSDRIDLKRPLISIDRGIFLVASKVERCMSLSGEPGFSTVYTEYLRSTTTRSDLGDRTTSMLVT